MDVKQIGDLLSGAGVLGLLGFALIGGWREWYMWTSQHTRLMKQREEDFAKILALKDTQLEEKDAECERERSERQKYEEYTFRLLESTRDLTKVATTAVTQHQREGQS